MRQDWKEDIYVVSLSWNDVQYAEYLPQLPIFGSPDPCFHGEGCWSSGPAFKHKLVLRMPPQRLLVLGLWTLQTCVLECTCSMRNGSAGLLELWVGVHM